MRLLFLGIFLSCIFNAFSIDPAIICHGGAGAVEESRFPGKYRGTILAVQIGHNVLQDGGSVLDAVEAAIRSMEMDENFNAGYGSVLNYDGEVEMDACIMDGDTMDVGAITGVQDIYHPITLSRRVMDKTNYNFLTEKGAMKLAISEGFQILPKGSLVTQRNRESLESRKNQSSTAKWKDEGNTVGCVAIDASGNLAAGTSTGGLTAKLPGRIGDTPIVGAGTYADNNIGALSATGTGEVIMKSVLIFDILKRVEYRGENIQSASQQACDDMEARYNDDGGVVGLDKNGNRAVGFSSDQMSWAYQNNNQTVYYGINPGDNYVYNIADCRNKNCILG